MTAQPAFQEQPPEEVLAQIAAGEKPLDSLSISEFPEVLTLSEQAELAEQVGNRGIYYLGLLALKGKRGGDFATAVFSLHYLQNQEDSWTLRLKIPMTKRELSYRFHSQDPEAAVLAQKLSQALEQAFPISKTDTTFEKTLHGI